MELLSQQKVDIAPAYLLALSKQVDALSRLTLLDRQGPLTQEFSHTLQLQFSDLAQYLALYMDDPVMRDCALLKCKLALQFYVWEKANSLMPREAHTLTSTMAYLYNQFHTHTVALQSLVHQERAAKAGILDNEKDKIIAGLRRQLGVKREYMVELEERVREVEDQNSKLYSKIITQAKQKVDYFSHSPAKTHQQLRSTSNERGSPRKKILTRSYEEQINDILQAKWKQQTMNDRRTSLNDYLHTYFTLKYGKPLAQQNEAGFRETVAYLAKSQQKHLFVLFQAVLQQQCDEGYFLQERNFLDRVLKCLKRYINQKYNRPFHELDRLLDPRADQKSDCALTESDVQTILTNIYKSVQVNTLQMILSELAFSRGQQQPHRLSCRRLINQLLDYEFKKHLMRVEDIVRQIQRLPDRASLLTFEQLQKITLRIIRDRARCENVLREQQRERPWTISEVIQIVQRGRHGRVRRD